MRFHQILCAAVSTLAAILASGCNVVIIPDSDTVTVRVINNTDFDIDPGIEYGVSENSLFSFNTDVVAPDEIVEADFDCDEIIVLTATEPVQLGFSTDYVLDSLPFFEMGFEYFCGEVVEFEFVGNGQEFDVFVDAGGENIY